MSGRSKNNEAVAVLVVIGLLLLPFALLYLFACWLDSRSYAAVARKWGWTAKQNDYGFYVPEAPAQPDSLATLFARVTDRRLLPACYLSLADIQHLATQYQTGDAPVLAFISNDPHNQIAEIGLVLSQDGIHWLDKDGNPLTLSWKRYELRSRAAVLEDGEIKLRGSALPSSVPAPFYGDLIHDFLAVMAKLMEGENQLDTETALFTPSASLSSAFGQNINGGPIKKPLQESIIEFLPSPLGLAVIFLVGFSLVRMLGQLWI